MRYTPYHLIVLLVCGILLPPEVCGETVATNQVIFTFPSANDLTASWKDIVATRAKELATNQVASIQSIIYSDILTALPYIDKRVVSPDPRIREAAVKDILGEGAYDLLEKRYLSQLTAAHSKADEKAVAAKILGWLLVSERAEQPLTDIATAGDPRVGVPALQGLAALGVEDAAQTLVQLLIAKKFPDMFGTQVVKIVKLSHTRVLEEHALDILEQNKDCPGVGYEMLFAIKGRKDIMDIIIRLFKSDYWMPANKEPENIEQGMRGLVVGLLMDEICSREELCKNDPELRQKVVSIAETSVVRSLYLPALCYLRRDGADEAYFERLLETPNLPSEKREYLKKGIDMMRSGIRLKFEKNPVTTLFYEPK